MLSNLNLNPLMLSGLWDTLSNNVAIAIYLAVIVVAILVVFIFMIKSESKISKISTDVQKAKDIKKIVQNISAATPMPSIKQEESVGKERFIKLNILDEKALRKGAEKFNNKLTLKEICIRLRNYAASEHKLYYDESQIRQFIAGLGVSKIMIMQGMSGTGKTSLAFVFGQFLDNPSLIVPVQPMWKERTDLIGYYNEFTKKFNVTDLLEQMYNANYSRDIYVTVLDEMNIARIEYYFAEFLSLLEIPNEESRRLTVVSDVWSDDPRQLVDGQIKLPVNMWYIGTANNDDSTFAIASKVYDRAMIMNLDKKAKPFEAPRTKKIKLSVDHFNKLVEEAIKEYAITERNVKRINELDKYMMKTFQVSFGNGIMKQIRMYVPLMIACGGDEIEAIDDIVSKKIMRKLESCNPLLVKNAVEEFTKYLDELFGENKMATCQEYLYHLSKMA